MHKLTLTAVTLCLAAQLATAQIKLPSPSPGASVMQTVGTTDMTITYSRPSLKGRQPFTSSFVPLGKVWRTGANSPTLFTTTTDVMVNGKTLAAGSYAILSIPEEGSATLIFSKNKTSTEQSYKQEEDALRVNLTPMENSEKVETFTIGFSDVTDSTAKLNFIWANIKAVADLKVDVAANSAANVDKAVAEKPNDPAVLQAAASYNLSKGRNLEQSLSWIDQSIAAGENYRNLYVKAQILGKMGKYAEALPLAQKALSLGQSSTDGAFPFFKDGIEKSISEYTAKVPAVPAIKGKGKKKA
ncbi:MULTISPECIES: DUF2911 domain-containing protein [Spirosoma]|uniref:DUF2911 domain-containing protein n=1 Tax=Spirosoma TaxID=107 RepID=UPI00096A01DD|nr:MULTISPECIES: DUF2911 domain-containing protein [Spirosoma]MBN8826199.1 DUF2911 domain-containing protein [Spirosoma sp.]OJW76905.1 MAG: hypothetical protein BGO59_22020 [Spirosoma sp. 48-14]